MLMAWGPFSASNTSWFVTSAVRRSNTRPMMLPKKSHDEIVQSISPYLSVHYAVLRLTSQGSLCMVPFKWLDLLKRGPTNNHCWGHSSTPIIMRMTSQPEWQAMAHNCRDFQHPNRHFAAKPTETCLLWRAPLNPFQVAPEIWPRTDGWLHLTLIDLTDLIDAHPASDVLLASVAEQNMARPQLQLLRRSPQSCWKIGLKVEEQNEMQTAWSTTEVLLGCKRRVALRILSSVFKHPLHQHDKDQADLKHLKKLCRPCPKALRNRWI